MVLVVSDHHDEEGTPIHGPYYHYFVCFGYILANVMYLVGSIYFFSWQTLGPAVNGDYLFVAGSILIIIMGAFVIVDDCTTSKALPHQKREHFLYVTSAVLFAVGTILFWPDLFHDKQAQHAHILAAWLFITGSSGFSLAAFFKALSLTHAQPDKLSESQTRRCYWLKAGALLNCMAGCSMFVTGSFLFRPGFEQECETIEGVEVKKVCANTIDSGAWLFLIGSAAFILDAICSAIRVNIFQRAGVYPGYSTNFWGELDEDVDDDS